MKSFQDLLMENCVKAVKGSMYTLMDQVIWWNEERHCFIVSETGGRPRYGWLPLATAKTCGIPMGILPPDEEIAYIEKRALSIYNEVCDRLNLV